MKFFSLIAWIVVLVGALLTSLSGDVTATIFQCALALMIKLDLIEARRKEP